MSIEETIRQFILNNLYFVEGANLTEDVSFLAEGIVDSMGAMELVAFVESQFRIKVEMSEVVVRNFDSIRNLANFVRHKRGANIPELSNATVATALSDEPPQVRND